jgi:hypothetical protein
MLAGCFMIAFLGKAQNEDAENSWRSSSESAFSFMCQGEYFEIEGIKYYSGDVVYLCNGGGNSTTTFYAKHADGSLFPPITTWDGVASSNGDNAEVGNSETSVSINGTTVIASYNDGGGDVSIEVTVVVVEV